MNAHGPRVVSRLNSETRAFTRLLAEARACTLCAKELPHPPRPILRVARGAPILIVGQAPGRRVHETGIPWNDRSGERLRDWLGVDAAAFYDTSRFAILPAGLCYPGSDRGKGDRPPIARCAPTWHPRFEPFLAPSMRLRVYVGAYAIAVGLPEERRRPVEAVVADWQRHLAAGRIPLPHPSPRNRLWLRRRPWVERDLVPVLRDEVARILAARLAC